MQRTLSIKDITALQVGICDALQLGIPICERPFHQIGLGLGCTEEEVIKNALELQQKGIIRRFGPIINPHALGRFSTLVMAHVSDPVLDKVIEAVNSLPNVSHNYLRDHHYNLWFTLQAKTYQQAHQIINHLTDQFGIGFHSLPAVKALKLQVYFPLSDRQISMPRHLKAYSGLRLTDLQKQILRRALPMVPIYPRPFAVLAEGIGTEQQVIDATNELIAGGVIRRIAAILNHYAIGLAANVLLVAEVQTDVLDQTIEPLASSSLVSHLVIRQTIEGWPYNLYAMIHAYDTEQIQSLVSDLFGQANRYVLLRTIRELKKAPITFTLQEGID